MLDLDTRTAVLLLSAQGHSSRAIGKALKLSRNTVRKVLRQGIAQVPALQRPEQLAEQLQRIRKLHIECQGNLQRVWEKLQEQGVEVGYSTLTAFGRRHEIGTKAKVAVGKYDFAAGKEMQHDTSPHTVKLGGRQKPLTCATMAFGFSHTLFAQCYQRWSRFECRVFHSLTAQYFEGMCARCTVDNSSVILAGGSGKHAIISDEMKVLSERFGFEFVAHELGDKNRSARVERAHYYIERNFYPGRSFDDIDDLNRQLRDWCDRVNAKPRRHLDATPRELLALERPHLRPLPLFVPEVYDLHSRRVDTEGYVNLHTNRYSVAAKLLGRRLELRESIRAVRIFDAKQLVAEHPRLPAGARMLSRLPEHAQRPQRKRDRPPSPQEKTLRAVGDELGQLVDRLRKHHGGLALKAVRQLHRMYLDYPTDVLRGAVAEALRHDLYDLRRIERMTLNRIAGDFFRVPNDEDEQ